MLGGGEPCHIFHQSEDWHIHFVAGEHRYPFPGIGQSHLLRGGYDYHACYAESLHQGQVYVARTRGHVDYEIIEVAPVGIGDKLLQSVRRHAAAP